MAAGSFQNVRIAGLASAVPGKPRDIAEDSPFEAAEIAKTAASTGVLRRHLASGAQCSSDLCCAAAEQLLTDTGCDRRSIEALIFVTQTPDYVLPATACTLQTRLSLSTSCASFDINLGCSGYVYGLWLASALLNGGVQRVLLLAGDTISKLVSRQDRSVSLLFGDAGTATLLEYHPGASALHFELGSDGAGASHLMVPAGGFRQRAAESGASEQNLNMNGGEIFAFTMQRVPEVCKAVLRRAQWDMAAVDHIVMHQANRFMLQHIAKLMRLPAAKVVLGLEDCGNTSCASIPLAITTRLRAPLRESNAKLLLAGFGVGYSWAAAAWESSPLVLPALVSI